jgi:pimeloyl-ACP methyl ester carboxylesterase
MMTKIRFLPGKLRLRTALIGVTFLLISTGHAWAMCPSDTIDVGGYSLWMQVAGEGDLNIVFISGNGSDSSAWANIEPRTREMGVRTVLYDRAGLGQSDLRPGPYTIDDEVNGLQRALELCGVNGSIVLVAHSYGGAISTLLAHSDARIEGLVSIDAVLPGDLNESVVESVLAEYTPQFAELEKVAPQLASAVIPVVEAYPATANRLNAVTILAEMPVIDIVAERSWMSDPDAAARIKRIHTDFVSASPEREGVFAIGSGHNVMQDQPEIVIAAISRMVARLE